MPIGAIPAAALSLGMGIVQGEWNLARGYQQQKKLQALQIQGMKEMSDYNKNQQLDIWNKTNIEAQLQHIKNAGMNPALMYGGTGPGGTLGNPSGTGVSGATAPMGQGLEIGAMGIQLGLMEAQRKVLETQANKNQAEADKTKGIDTEEAQTRIASLTQGISNQKAQEEMMKADTALKTLQLEIGKHTQEDAEDFIYYQTKQAMYHVGEAERQAFISRATMNAKVDIIRTEAIAAALKNELTKAQTGKTLSDITVNQKQIAIWVEQNMREWDKMSQENQKIATQKLIAEYNTDPVNKVTEGLARTISDLFIITTSKK